MDRLMADLSLSEWHDRLDRHFRELRSERDLHVPGSPVFALEHGLTDAEREGLGRAVRVCVSAPGLPAYAWLPLVVYAAEIGYRYEGDEYWPVFEADTPGWKRRGSNGRLYIRQKYELFASTYGGARPSGAWAEWFKNIAWPITHAVLPTDLQRHLARLLSDYRHAFTAELLQDHDALGARLVARSQDTSARFRKFAENTRLLGLVSAALLLGDDDEIPLLSAEVLHRIVVDLSHERQAGLWLRNAKRAAVQVRRKGVLPASQRTAASTSAPDSDRFPNLELRLSLRRTAAGWALYAHLPSFESLATRFPHCRAELERTRCRVAGVERVRPQGALMYPQGPLRLNHIPSSGRSVIRVEGASVPLDSVVADHCRMPPDPLLFRVRESGFAVEVRTNSVRPGASYVLLSRLNPPALPSLSAELTSSAVEDAFVLQFDVPGQIGGEQINDLRNAGLGVTSQVVVWPAGLVPAEWDGEGRTIWPLGEDPIIGIRTERPASRCAISTPEDFFELQWPEELDRLFVQVRDLPVGDHPVEVAVFGSDDEPLARGELLVRILEPVDTAGSAGARQGLQVRAYPARPSLDELWLGSGVVVVDGPRGEKATFDLRLVSRGGRSTLARKSFSAALPVTAARWSELLRSAQGEKKLSSFLGEAEEIHLFVSNPILGSTAVRAQRPFEPLRWAAGYDAEGPFARLIDHVGSGELDVLFFNAETPDRSTSVAAGEDGKYRSSGGGLLLASQQELRAGLVIPPLIRGGLESLSKLCVRPSLKIGNRSAQSIRSAIELAAAWTSAVPADENALRLQAAVNDAIVARVAGTIAGPRWWKIELEALDDRSCPSTARLSSGLGHSSEERASARRLMGLLERPPEDPDSCARVLAQALCGSVRHTDVLQELTTGILRLATLPGSLDAASPEAAQAITAVLTQPATLRLARILVLVVTPLWDPSRSVLEAWSWG